MSSRHDRLAARTVRTGLLDVADATALAGIGFEPVSEVLGAVANRVTPGGFYSSGAPLPSGSPFPPGSPLGPLRGRTYTSSSGSVAVGVPPTLIALKAGYRTALTRLLGEAQAVGADGVVGLSLTHTRYETIWEFLAVGTAVRSTGRTHTDRPFTTDLTGAQVAAALRSGWLPLSFLIVPVMAVRWVDATSAMQQRRLAPNAEIDAYTDLVTTCRRQAVTEFGRAASEAHGDAAVLSDLTLDFDPRDRSTATATVTATGTALGQVDVRQSGTPTLTMMPLNRNRTEGSRR